MAMFERKSVQTGDAHRTSRLVRTLRWALPAGVIGSILAVVLWPYVQTVTDMPVRIAVDQAQRAAAEALSMRNPSYTGTTGSDVPYAVRADSATLEPGDPERVRLHGIRAELNDERAWQLSAVGAVFNTDTREIALMVASRCIRPTATISTPKALPSTCATAGSAASSALTGAGPAAPWRPIGSRSTTR